MGCTPPSGRPSSTTVSPAWRSPCNRARTPCSSRQTGFPRRSGSRRDSSAEQLRRRWSRHSHRDCWPKGLVPSTPSRWCTGRLPRSTRAAPSLLARGSLQAPLACLKRTGSPGSRSTSIDLPWPGLGVSRVCRNASVAGVRETRIGTSVGVLVARVPTRGPRIRETCIGVLATSVRTRRVARQRVTAGEEGDPNSPRTRARRRESIARKHTGVATSRLPL